MTTCNCHLFQSIMFTIISGAVINDITNNPMVLANIEELQKAWDDLNDLLEEKEKDLQVSPIKPNQSQLLFRKIETASHQ